MPASRNIGTNTMQMASVETSAGSAICCAPVENRRLDLLALLEMLVDVLDRHGRIVHQDADRQRKPAERHDVDGLARAPTGRRSRPESTAESRAK